MLERSCLRVVPAERASAAELCELQWRGAESPSHTDMVTLPCPQLKIHNVCDPGTATADVTPLVGESRRQYGKIIKYKLCPEEGSLYLLFNKCLDAELACQVMHRKQWRGRNLLPMFFPVENHLDDDSCSEYQ
ncbi:RNA recognition motif domain [Trinorchestia longiramus]|nr:RNA recognition motif domain [Trinorchestia longiramus]